MTVIKSGYFIFIFAVMILTINTATAIGTEIIGVGSTTLDAGSTATLQVDFANAVDVAGISLDISYNPKIIEIMDVSSNNDAISGSVITSNIDSAEGKVKIILTNINLINTINSIPIINIVVHTIGDAGEETKLVLQNVEVTDTNFLPATPETITNGYVRINDKGKASFTEQIDTVQEESNVNDETTPSALVTYKSTVEENNPEDSTSSSPSATDKVNISGFGFVLTVLILLFVNRINIIKWNAVLKI